MRRLYGGRIIKPDDLIAISDELKEIGGSEHDELAREVRAMLFRDAPWAEEPDQETWVQHRRRQMVLRTEWLANKAKEGAREEAGGD